LFIEKNKKDDYSDKVSDYADASLSLASFFNRRNHLDESTCFSQTNVQKM